MALPKLAWLGVTAVVLAACASPAYVDQSDGAAVTESTSLDRIVYQVHDEFDEAPPRCIGILPFELDTAKPTPNLPATNTVASLAAGNWQGAASGADEFDDPGESEEISVQLNQAESVRRAFYAHLSLHAQKDIELGRVDFVISRMPAEDRTNLARIGAALGCDALLVGKVTKYGSDFFALYSSVAVGADVKVVRARDGAVLWEGRHVARSRGGSVPVSPIGIVMSIVNAANNINGEQFNRVTDDLARRLVSTIPDTWSDDPDTFAGYGDPRNYRFVAANSLNLRGGPGKAYSVQGRLERSEVVEVVGPKFNGEWVPVKLSTGRVGYVSTRYLSDQPPQVELAIAPRASHPTKQVPVAVEKTSAAVPCGEAVPTFSSDSDVMAHPVGC